MSLIVLFNGPPRAGKDTCAQLLETELNKRGISNVQAKFSAPLKRTIHEMFGYENVALDHFENVKDEALDSMWGMSPRQAYIWLSEEVIKPKFGSGYFGKVMALRSKALIEQGVVIISDFGFRPELDELVTAVGKDKIIVVNIFRDGCDFSNDSRDYVFAERDQAGQSYSFTNNKTIEHLNNTYVKELATIIDHTLCNIDK